MTPAEISRIAGSLSKAQREAVLAARQALLHGDNVFEVKAGGATIALCRKGVIRNREFRGLTGRGRRGYSLTDSGIAVRDHLKANPDG